MDTDGQDGKHPHLDPAPTARPFPPPQRSLTHHTTTLQNASSHQGPGHLILPVPTRGSALPAYAPSASPSHPPRVLPNPNNQISSPPAVTIHSDPRYNPGQPHGVGNYPSRSYSVDSGVQRSTNPSALSGREGLSGPGGPSEKPQGQMEPQHAHHPSTYQVEHTPNGLVHHPATHHAMPLVQHHEQYQQPPPGTHHGMAHGYPPPNSYAPAYGQQTPAGYGGQQHYRKKAVRAQQACQQCRQRKQKCDEQRPCGFCQKEGIHCEYKDTPPPKADRSMMQMQETLNQVLNAVTELKERAGIRSTGTKRKRNGDNAEDDSPRLAKSPTTDERPDEGDEESDEMMPQSAASESVLPTPIHSHQSAVGFQNPQEVQENIELQKSGAILPEVGGIPADHTTSVDHLRTWPDIKDLYAEAGLLDTLSITEHERAQGFLRCYGIGQTGDPLDERVNDTTAASPASDNSDVVEPDGLWGSNLIDGHLRLDEATVNRLYESYFRHFHILHPFLDRPRVKKMLDYFIARYKPATGTSSSPFAVPAVPADSKRSTHLGTPQSTLQVNSPDYGREFPPPSRPVERSINNAIILLVLALGKIAEHKQHLRGPAKPNERTSTIYSHASPQSVPSPSSSVRPSPTSSHATISSVHSPSIADSRYESVSRAPSEALSVKKELKNIDVFPGMAYYAFAADILNTFVSFETVRRDYVGNDPRRELLQVWAFILAGLYMGQLCRAMESFGWIEKACKAWLSLSRQFPDRDLKESPSKNTTINLVKFAFFTCIQLESDIRAECQFDSTGIGRYENDLPLPNGYTDDIVNHKGEEMTDSMVMYCLQIQLRRTLNRTHNYVYGPEKQPIWEGGLSYAGPKEMLQELDELRLFIEFQGKPQALREWKDEDPTSNDINICRVRGKYYGCRYVILRPFLQHAMYKILPQQVELEDNLTANRLPKIKLGGKSEDTYQNQDREYTRLVISAAKMCIQAAINSTKAFDGLLPDRFLVTNIHGTALAQFGNMLVLCAAYGSWLGPSHANLVPRGDLIHLLERTIALMHNLAPLSRIMGVNEQILKTALKKVKATPDKHLVSGSGNVGIQSAHSSFGA